MERDQLEKIERELASLSGVESLRLRTNVEGAIDSISAVAASDRLPKRVAADIRTALFARHGIELSRRQVRVAAQRTLNLDALKLDPAALAPAEIDPPPRIQFKSVNVFRENLRVEAQVELRRGERVLIGTAAGPAIRKSLPRLVGRAAIVAISQLAPPGVAWELLDVERRRIGERAALHCHLALLQGRRETHLMGSVFQAGDALEATVLAVLDATNRLLPVLEGDDAIEYEVEPFVARANA